MLIPPSLSSHLVQDWPFAGSGTALIVPPWTLPSHFTKTYPNFCWTFCGPAGVVSGLPLNWDPVLRPGFFRPQAVAADISPMIP